jgi:murein DD-endopeptidase MepM/ murein hydrolase activator NlpD
VVASAGPNGGYGNAVLLRHHGAYSTLYAHLSRFGPQVRAGTRVRQGDTIGYVGATGWATGPHLHYEFRVGGDARNPQTVALPNAAPMASESFIAFLAQIEPLTQQLRLARELPTARLASSD